MALIELKNLQRQCSMQNKAKERRNSRRSLKIYFSKLQFDVSPIKFKIELENSFEIDSVHK